MISIDIDSKNYDKKIKTFIIPYDLIGGFCSEIFLRNPKTDRYMCFYFNENIGNYKYKSLNGEYTLLLRS
jgi:hypothetical protein